MMRGWHSRPLVSQKKKAGREREKKGGFDGEDDQDVSEGLRLCLPSTAMLLLTPFCPSL